MTPSINAVGFTLEQKQSDLVESKLKRVSYADDLIVDLLMKIKHDKAYVFDVTVTKQWTFLITKSKRKKIRFRTSKLI